MESTGWDADGWLDAAGDVWQAWLLGAAAAVAAAFFHYTEGAWTTAAESFDAQIIVGIAAVALGYGVREVRDRISPF